ncbi:MAG: hypothetical protein JSS53_00645 [Proteobacteria bacterium]|nr:hypothetical protein [Pseudomonadota bacterium]
MRLFKCLIVFVFVGFLAGYLVSEVAAAPKNQEPQKSPSTQKSSKASPKSTIPKAIVITPGMSPGSIDIQKASRAVENIILPTSSSDQTNDNLQQIRNQQNQSVQSSTDAVKRDAAKAVPALR